MFHEIGYLVHTVNFIFEKLGHDIRHLDGSFPNPCQTSNKTHVIFNICYMIKLARSAFSDMKSIHNFVGAIEVGG